MWVDQKARIGFSVKIPSRPINHCPPRARSYLRFLQVILAYFGRASVFVWYQTNIYYSTLAYAILLHPHVECPLNPGS